MRAPSTSWLFSSYRDSVVVAKWIAERTTPDDFIAVRGFEPQIYLLADRRYPARFFWTTFFVLEQRESPARRAVWAKEDLATLTAYPPKFVVAQTKRTTGPDSAAYFEPLGYQTKLVVNEFTILGRNDASITPLARSVDMNFTVRAMLRAFDRQLNAHFDSPCSRSPKSTSKVRISYPRCRASQKK